MTVADSCLLNGGPAILQAEPPACPFPFLPLLNALLPLLMLGPPKAPLQAYEPRTQFVSQCFMTWGQGSGPISCQAMSFVRVRSSSLASGESQIKKQGRALEDVQEVPWARASPVVRQRSEGPLRSDSVRVLVNLCMLCAHDADALQRGHLRW